MLTKKQKEQVLIAKIKLHKCANGNNPEVNHEVADYVLHDLLVNIGLKDVADIYKSVTKWYA